jgi:homoserine kinase
LACHQTTVHKIAAEGGNVGMEHREAHIDLVLLVWAVLGEATVQELRESVRGEILTPLCDPPEMGWLLAVPEFRCSTRQVFESLSPGLTGSIQKLRMLEEAIHHGDVEAFARHIVNDLEPGVVRIEPRLARIREALQRLGAMAVGLTGSGSAMFALFRSQGDIARLLDAGSILEGARLRACVPVGFGARVVTEDDDHRHPDLAG